MAKKWGPVHSSLPWSARVPILDERKVSNLDRGERTPIDFTGDGISRAAQLGLWRVSRAGSQDIACRIET